MRPTLGPLLAVLALSVAACGDRLSRERAAAAQTHADRARAALEKADYARAVIAAETASAYDPLDPKMRDLALRARLTALAAAPQSVQVDRPAELDYQAEVLSERDPAHAHVYKTARGYLALVRNDEVSAEELLREATSKKPNWAPAQVALAQLFVRQRKVDDAVAAYEAALSSDPKNARALAGIGRLFLDKGQADKAVEALSKAVEAADSAQARMDLASALTARGQGGQAVEHLQRAVALEPRNGEAHRRLGEWLLAAGQVDAAQQQLAAASQLGAEPLATFGLGQILSRRGEHAQAARHFEAVFNTDPKLLPAGYQAGLSFEQAGDAANAARMYTRYLQAASQDPTEAQRVADAQQRLQRLSAPLPAPAPKPGTAPKPKPPSGSP